MFRFTVDIAGEVQLDRGIARFSEGVGDYRPIWPAIAEEFYAEEKEQFASEGAAGGEGWVPLSPAYAAWKEAHFPGQPIMQRSGRLEASLTSQSSPDAVYSATRKGLTLGSRVPYGIFHQSIADRKVLPRRAVIQLSEGFKRFATREIQAYLVDMAVANGFRKGLTTQQVAQLVARTGSGVPPRPGTPRKVPVHG